MFHATACVVLWLTTIGLGQEPKAESAAKVEKLFDGKTLEGWTGDSRYWKVEDGTITGQTTADNLLESNTFLIWQGKPVADFELHLKFRLENGNSGIQYRSRVIDEEKFVVGGYQADLCELTPKQAWILGILYEEKGRGILARRGQRVRISENGTRTEERFAEEADLVSDLKDGEWHEYVIRAEGPRLTHSVDGRLFVDVTDLDEKKRAERGILAIQLHTGPPMKVQYKDIELTRLPEVDRQ
ncbi:MAG: DUF1080 domain-containing protein [Planctomycetota bacterium]